MNEILHANIFFFITGIAVIICGSLLCVALFHGIKALKTFRRIVERIEAETESIAEDIGSVRAYFSGEGLLRRLLAKLMGTSRAEKDGSRSKKSAKRKSGELEIKDEA